MDELKLYCDCCKKEVAVVWNERSVPDVVQDDDFGRTQWATDYQIVCATCGHVIEDYKDDEG